MKTRHKTIRLCYYIFVVIINMKLISVVRGSADEDEHFDVDSDEFLDTDAVSEEFNLSSEDSGFYSGEEALVEVEEDGLEKVDDPPSSNYNYNYHREKPSYPFSPDAMKKLAVVEAGIYEEMETYVGKMELRLDMMRRYIKDYEESSVQGRAHLDTDEEREYAIVANPLMSHRMLRRFAFDFVNITYSFQDFLDEEFLQSMGDLNDKLIYPNVTDYVQSLESLLRIQRYTNLDTEEFANGKLGHLQTNVSLRSRHAFEIGLTADLSQKLALEIEWIELALHKLDEEEDVDEDFRSEILEALQMAVDKHDKNWDKWHNENDLFFAEKVGSNYGLGRSRRVKISDILQKDATKLRNQSEYGLHTKFNFMTLCSGVNLKTEYEKSRLKCWHETKINPYWTINPLKIELLNEDPPVLQIYDLLDPKRIQWIMDIATPTLKRSEVINVDDPKASEVTNVRTSSQTWVVESNYPYLYNIMKNIELITGLRVRDPTSSEIFQVATYGTSHHYDEHLDALMDDRRTKINGDRIGTFMFYLSDVEVGGKTAFPVLGTAANPVAGSAVFWHNLKLNGEVDKRTWHGGCPVVHGIKWVANKWILSHDSWNKRICSLDPNE